MCMLEVLCGNPALSTDFWNVLDRSGQRAQFTSFLQFSTYGECTPTTGGRGCEKDMCCNGLVPTALLQQVTQKSTACHCRQRTAAAWSQNQKRGALISRNYSVQISVQTHRRIIVTAGFLWHSSRQNPMSSCIANFGTLFNYGACGS